MTNLTLRTWMELENPETEQVRMMQKHQVTQEQIWEIQERWGKMIGGNAFVRVMVVALLPILAEKTAFHKILNKNPMAGIPEVNSPKDAAALGAREHRLTPELEKDLEKDLEKRLKDPLTMKMWTRAISLTLLSQTATRQN